MTDSEPHYIIAVPEGVYEEIRAAVIEAASFGPMSDDPQMLRALAAVKGATKIISVICSETEGIAPRLNVRPRCAPDVTPADVVNRVLDQLDIQCGLCGRPPERKIGLAAWGITLFCSKHKENRVNVFPHTELETD